MTCLTNRIWWKWHLRLPKLREGSGTPLRALLPGKSHGWSGLVGCSPWGLEESDTTERLHFHFSLSRMGEGNGNPLQCSCLENPRDGGAWWAAISGVAQSWTRLKRLSSKLGYRKTDYLSLSECLLWRCFLLETSFCAMRSPQKCPSRQPHLSSRLKDHVSEPSWTLQPDQSPQPMTVAPASMTWSRNLPTWVPPTHRILTDNEIHGLVTRETTSLAFNPDCAPGLGSLEKPMCLGLILPVTYLDIHGWGPWSSSFFFSLPPPFFFLLVKLH